MDDTYTYDTASPQRVGRRSWLGEALPTLRKLDLVPAGRRSATTGGLADVAACRPASWCDSLVVGGVDQVRDALVLDWREPDGARLVLVLFCRCRFLCSLWGRRRRSCPKGRTHRPTRSSPQPVARACRTSGGRRSPAEPLAHRHDREFTRCGSCEYSARWPSRMVKTAKPSARAGHGAVQPGEDQVQTRPSHERVPTTLCRCQANEASTVLTETRDSGHGAIVRLAGLSRHPSA